MGKAELCVSEAESSMWFPTTYKSASDAALNVMKSYWEGLF